MDEKIFMKKLTSLVGEETARNVRSALELHKPILITGTQGPTGKTTLCNLINEYGGVAVEERLCFRVALDKMLV